MTRTACENVGEAPQGGVRAAKMPPGRPAPFKLERFFAKYEFNAPRLMCCSDCQALTLREVLEMADEECKQLYDNMVFTYTHPAGHPLLREEVVRVHYEVAKPDDVLVLAPEEGIFIAMQCILSPGDHFVVTRPGYQSLYELGCARGAELSEWRVREMEDGSLKFCVEDLRQAIRPNTKLVVVNFPHNPTGYIPTRAEFEEIVSLCRERGAYLFCDEMYRLMEINESSRLPAAVDVYEKAISLGGMSKTFAMPGIRIGWVATRDQHLFEQMAAYKDYTTICNSASSEILALIGLRAAGKIIARNMGIIRDNIAAFEAFFAKHADVFEWCDPLGGSIAFPKLKKGNIDQLVEELVEKHGILLLPSTLLDYPSNRFRVSLGRTDTRDHLEVFDSILMDGRLRSLQ